MTVLLGLASASAPASIGNVGVGFDILGQSFDAARDLVTAQAEAEPGVRLGRVDGLVDALPAAVGDNTALAAAASLLTAAGAPTGVRLSIRKGVPLSAGMGGSAASAVAAVVAGLSVPQLANRSEVAKATMTGAKCFFMKKSGVKVG